MGISLPKMTTTSIALGHDEQEQVQEQVEDHGQKGQVAAAGREFGDTYEADTSDAIKESSLT
jgi:hypothetical protein